jgi:hypothetical protein
VEGVHGGRKERRAVGRGDGKVVCLEDVPFYARCGVRGIGKIEMKSTNRKEECKILYVEESNLTNEKMKMNLTSPSKALDCRFVRKRAPGALGVS